MRTDIKQHLIAAVVASCASMLSIWVLSTISVARVSASADYETTTDRSWVRPSLPELRPSTLGEPSTFKAIFNEWLWLKTAGDRSRAPSDR